MKKFDFPLNRVLDYRRSQARLEESKLEQLHAQLRAIEDRQLALAAELSQSQQLLLSASSAASEDFAALDAFRRYTSFEAVRTERARIEYSRKISAQLSEVTRRRRDVRLLENLKDRRMRTWKSGLEREVAQQADESFLARVARSRAIVSSRRAA